MDIRVIGFLLLTLFAEIVGTVGGFGSSVFFVPIANFYFDFNTVLGMTALFHIGSNLSKIALFRKGMDKKLLLWLGLPSVLFVILGGWLSSILNTEYLKFGLASFIVLFSLFFLLFEEVQIKPGKIQAVIGGTSSGFLAGLVGTGGAVRGLTMAAFNLEKSTFVATSAGIDLAVDLSRGGVYFLNGYFTKQVLMYVPVLLIIGWVGTWIGRKLLKKISQKSFKRISLGLILIVGVVMMYPYFSRAFF
jgi:uncharacterized membrane protein YfcA